MKTLLAVLIGLTLSRGSYALKAPPTQAQIDRLIFTIRKGYNGATSVDDLLKASEVARQALTETDLSQATPTQILRLAKEPFAPRIPETRSLFTPRLQEIAKESNVQGLDATILLLVRYDSLQDAAFAERLKPLLKHPALAECIRQNDSAYLYLLTRTIEMDAKTLGESDLLSSVIGLLEIPHSPYLLPPWSFLFALTLSPEAKIAHEKREAFRIKLLQLTENALKAKPQNGEEPTFRQELRSMRDYLKGSAAAGKLLGNPAPEIAFQWTKPSRFEKLSHLKGKIVLVNFWTTWAPYKQSFEMLRRLQERYREAKVVILGVTSLQGTHFNIQEDKRLDTKGRPQWERTLMQRFMREMGITWQVAFATGEVFQPDYGVRDLPHFTLLDPAGRVRLNAPLHPKLESEITTQIESLLKESPRPAPK